MNLYEVLLQGETWTHEISPCSRQAIRLLENNESVVTWLAPKEGLETYSSHIPVIQYKSQ